MVVTSAADGSSRRAIYSAMPSASNGRGRAQSSQGLNTATASVPVLNRRNSTSKLSDISRFIHERAQSSRDLAMESNRESMIALSDFLRRSEPPATNFMSRPESDASSLHSRKKSAFKIFGRQKSQKTTKGLKLMRLPDSAVAAKTTSGARHIAISIPLEYDHPYYDAPARSLPPPRPHSQSKLSSERGTVTVLKPVAEVQESMSSSLTKTKSNEEANENKKRKSQAESFTTPAADVLDPETARTLENYYTQLNRQQRNPPMSSNAEGKLAVKPDSTATHKSYVAVSPVDTARQDSTQSDPRHSGRTAYSTTSLGSHPAHSRGPSSASNAPSATPISGLKLDLSPRTSSVAKVPAGLQTELAKAYLANKGPAIEDITRSASLSEKCALCASDTTASGTSTSHSPPTAFGTAETAQSYNAAAGIQTVSRSNTPKSLHPANPAPTRQLPDVPESPCIPSFLPSPSPPISWKNSPTVEAIDDTISKRKSTASLQSKNGDSRQSRQDRVKARKQRDMAIHRDKSTHREKASLVETASSMNPHILVTTPAPNVKRRSKSREMARRRALNSVTDIMLVADLAPYTSVVKFGDIPLSPSPERAVKKRTRDSDSNGTMSARGTHTPPSSMGSESDTITQDRSLIRTRGSAKSSGLDAKRQERRVKRNMNLREKEMDVRLGKVERDNAMIMSTLSGIASSFGELSRVLPGTGIRFRGEGLLTKVERETRKDGDGGIVHGELTKLDPVMRELEFGAGKVSQESLKESYEDLFHAG